MKKRLFMGLFALAVILSMSVTAFAFMPNQYSKLPDVGGWQIGTFDDGIRLSWHRATCHGCGLSGYEIIVPEAIQYGDVFAVISDSTADTRQYGDSGVVAFWNAEDPHETTAHRSGLFVVNDVSIPETDVPLFSVNSHTIDTIFNGIIGGFHRVVDGGISPSYERVYPIYQDSCRDRHDCGAYAFSTFAVPLYVDEVDNYIETLNQSSYEQGLANGSANADALVMVESVIDGVSFPIFNAFSEISVLGLSVMSLVGLFVSVVIIMAIIKVVRG